LFTERVKLDSSYSVLFSKEKQEKFTAFLLLLKTIFICLVLAVGSIYSAQDAQNLVLLPIERMIEKVKLLAKDPLAASKDDINSKGVISLATK